MRALLTETDSCPKYPERISLTPFLPQVLPERPKQADRNPQIHTGHELRKKGEMWSSGVPSRLPPEKVLWGEGKTGWFEFYGHCNKLIKSFHKHLRVRLGGNH